MNPPFNSELANNFVPNPAQAPTVLLPNAIVLPTNPYQGASLRLWAPDIKPALIQQWNLTLQHQFSNNLTLQAGYVGQKGTHLMVPLQLSQGELQPDGTATPSQFMGGPSNPIYQEVMNNGGNFKESSSIGNQSYQALQVVLQKRLSNGLEGQVSYTYSKCMTDSSGYYGAWSGEVSGFGASTYWQNVYNQRSEWGPCYFDQKHTLSANAIYQIPFGKDRKYGSNLNPVVNGIAGGWNVSAIVSMRTGMPGTAYSWWYGGAMATTGTFWLGRLNCISQPSYGLTNAPSSLTGGYMWFTNNGNFAAPTNGQWGNCGNSTIYGPGSKDLDLSVQKDFRIDEKKKVQLRGDFINATNSVLPLAPATGLGTGMGQITGTQFPRLITLAAKFYF
jgi:hypothetical protein